MSVILHGIVGDCPWFRCNRLTLQIYAFLMAGINKICSIEANMYAYLAVFSAFDGFASGKSLYSSLNCLCLSYVGKTVKYGS